MVWVILSTALGMTVGGIWLGRQWGLQTGEKRAQEALAEQRARYSKVLFKNEMINASKDRALREIGNADTKEEAVDVASGVTDDWNSGR